MYKVTFCIGVDVARDGTVISARSVLWRKQAFLRLTESFGGYMLHEAFGGYTRGGALRGCRALAATVFTADLPRCYAVAAELREMFLQESIAVAVEALEEFRLI